MYWSRTAIASVDMDIIVCVRATVQREEKPWKIAAVM